MQLSGGSHHLDGDPKVTAALTFTDARLEDALISAITADPSKYDAIRQRLPEPAEDVFAIHASAWHDLVHAIESGASPVTTQPPAGPPVDAFDAADILAELYRRRTLARLANTALHDLAQGTPTQAVARMFAAELPALQKHAEASGSAVAWGDDLLHRVTHDLAVADAARAAGQRTMGVASSGLPTLDLVLNGWQPGALYILGGPPGIGKTSLALQWACEAVAGRSAIVVYITYENSPQNLALKAIGRLAGVPPVAAERGKADKDRWTAGVDQFRAIASQLALVPADASTSVEYIEKVTRDAVAQRSGVPAFVIVDYLQRMAYSERFNTLQENVAVLAQRLRDLAAHLDIPVLALSSLVAGEDETTLRLSALAQRGELEYASDVVLLLGPRAETGLASAERIRTTFGLRLVDLMIAKNRYGEANRVIPLLFRPALGDFQEESKH